MFVGRALIRGRVQSVEIGVGDDGNIVRIAKTIRGGERVDLGERLILPAATDVHVHLREPGGSEAAEGFLSGTEAAALGGVVAVADMPNTEPPVSDGERLAAKISRARGQLAVDAVIYAAVTDPRRVPGLAHLAGAFKLYLSPTSGELTAPASGTVPDLLQAVADSGLALSVHAEDPRRFRARPSLATVEEWDAHRPVEAEIAGVDVLLAAPPSLRLNVAHVTNARVSSRVRSAGQCFEVTPHHLLLSTSRKSGPQLKVNPPLRSEPERVALWSEFQTGAIPLLASDHAPHSLESKGKPFELAPSGMPGVETMVPLLLEKVRAGELPLEVLLRAASDRPARWLGLPHGRLAPGSRAHFMIVDFRDRREVRADRLRTACGWSAFEGWPAVFPYRVYRSGALIVEEGSFVGRSDGRVVRPDYALLRERELEGRR